VAVSGHDYWHADGTFGLGSLLARCEDSLYLADGQASVVRLVGGLHRRLQWLLESLLDSTGCPCPTEGRRVLPLGGGHVDTLLPLSLNPVRKIPTDLIQLLYNR
jgi:hypothetical protein